MSFNREKNEYFFPSKVYRCACLGHVIDYCFENDLNSFTEIHDEVHRFVLSNDDINKVFAVKCDEERKNCIFVCEKHLGIVIFAKKTYSCTEKPRFNNTTVFYTETGGISRSETYCTGCIKHYLRLTSKYFYYKKF